MCGHVFNVWLMCGRVFNVWACVCERERQGKRESEGDLGVVDIY